MEHARIRTKLVEISLLALACLLFSACVESKCMRNEDCASGQVCVVETGVCVDAECIEHDDCGDGLICEDSFCVEGCVETSDCGLGQSCYNNRCAETQSECGCPVASTFCGVDLNPRSDTSGQMVCVSDSYPSGVALFFGSVKCSICRDIFSGVMEIRASLVTDGEDPHVIFVQLKTRPVDPSEVQTSLGSANAAVVQATESQDIWEAYNASWYDLILVDSFGCLTEHFEDLHASGVEGDVGDQIETAWRDAMSDECPEE